MHYACATGPFEKEICDVGMGSGRMSARLAVRGVALFLLAGTTELVEFEFLLSPCRLKIDRVHLIFESETGSMAERRLL